jgi:hypothetical protein
LDINNPSYFETTGDYDFYERFGGRNGVDCLDGENVTFSIVLYCIVLYLFIFHKSKYRQHHRTWNKSSKVYKKYIKIYGSFY